MAWRFICGAMVWCAVWCSVMGAVVSEVHAQQAPDEVYVPDALKPWVPWVMDSHKERQCALIEGTHVCEWPGRMTLEVEERQGGFTLDALVQREGTKLVLPGDARHWPQDVRVNGVPAMVVEGDSDIPSIEPGRGRVRVTGRFEWKSAPEVLALPMEVASVELTLDGERVPWPRVDDSGQLWVKEASAASVGEADTIRVSVYRHVSEHIPLSVTTMLELNVAGRAREMSLGKPLLQGGLPVTVTGELPTQISADGEVRVYVRPGTHQIEIQSYFDAPVEELEVPAQPAAFFDPVEYWVWTPDETLRSVEIEGLLTIDPSRTTLPQQWRGKTTLSAKPGEVLRLKTTRRGQPEQSPNQVNLDRTLWLDIDGRGYTIKDKLTGTFHQGWRLNYDTQYGELGRVMDNAQNEALLITGDLSGSNRRGVEIRNAVLNVEAEVRIEGARNELPAVGWSHDVNSLHATLLMPPGWSVLASQGVDDMSGTWIDSWDLLEFFVVLMIAFVMGKLFGWPWGVISGLALVLAHGQPDAPRYVWFHIAAVLALLRVLPHKRWLRLPAYIYLFLSFIVLISTFGYYAHQQVRAGLHPQISRAYSGHYESQSGSRGAPGGFYEEKVAFGAQQLVSQEMSMDMVSPQLDEPRARDRLEGSALAEKMSDSVAIRSGSSSKGNYTWSQLAQQIDPKEVVQTGPGLPNWTWQSWELNWSGPVAHDHEIKLWLMSPALNLVAHVLSVFCFLLMALVVLAPGKFAPRRRIHVDVYRMLRKLAASAVVGASILGVSALLAPSFAHAQQSVLRDIASPSPEMLQELERRLLAADTCERDCITVPSMTLSLSAEGEFMMEAEVHARRQSGWRLPGPASLVGMERVSLDGIQTNDLRRNAMDMVYLRIPEGRHRVTLTGRLNAQNVLTLQLDPSARPHRITTRLAGWSVDGLDEYDRPDTSLQLSRQASEETPRQGDESAQELPAWYTVERTLLLGLPWQSRTLITRLDTTRPQLVKLPLLQGEAVITEGVRVENGEALINFERGVGTVNYMSEFALAMNDAEARIVLTAPLEKPWTETWNVECSRIWRCDAEGLVPVRTVESAVFMPTWKPWPGESLTLTVRKPRGAEGEATTVTRVDYRVVPGERRLKATLSMTMRASQGGWQRVELPAGAELQEVKIDELVRSIRPDKDGSVSLPVTPGEQHYLMAWIQPWERSLFERFPEVKLGSEAVNVTMTMLPGANRWLLWTVGPSWGPAVLFWSHVVLLIVLALLLGRLKQLPLRTYQWLLLMLGMSQLPLIAALPIVLWFAMLVWRKERPLQHAPLFALFQLFLVFWTIITLGVIYAAVHFNLLMDVDMQVRGRDSSNAILNWYVDRSEASLPTAGVLSVPLLVWRAVMFAWVLWLVSSLMRWLPWAWRCVADGQLWKPLSSASHSPVEASTDVIVAHEVIIEAESTDGEPDE